MDHTFTVPLREAYVLMLAGVKGLLEDAVIAAVEMFFDDDWYMTERLYRLMPNPEGWNLLELGFAPEEDGSSSLTEVRLMREIEPESAPMLGDSIPRSLEYNGLLYQFEGDGGGRGFLIGAGNQYRPLSVSYWVVFQAEADGVTHQLVYATWDGGQGVYAGRLVPESDAHIHLAPDTDSN